MNEEHKLIVKLITDLSEAKSLAESDFARIETLEDRIETLEDRISPRDAEISRLSKVVSDRDEEISRLSKVVAPVGTNTAPQIQRRLNALSNALALGMNRTCETYAQGIVTSFHQDGAPGEIVNMILTLRTLTRLPLKEAKDEIEKAISNPW